MKSFDYPGRQDQKFCLLPTGTKLADTAGGMLAGEEASSQRALKLSIIAKKPSRCTLVAGKKWKSRIGQIAHKTAVFQHFSEGAVIRC